MRHLTPEERQDAAEFVHQQLVGPVTKITIYYGTDTRKIYLRIPARDELGEPSWIDHGIDNATALRLRDELNDALLGRPVHPAEVGTKNRVLYPVEKNNL